ncbi:MAG: hypothetical protein IKJ32_06080 [Clostridia bacterium]|nr:hypothetical protein [Clostridia bacterium]
MKVWHLLLLIIIIFPFPVYRIIEYIRKGIVEYKMCNERDKAIHQFIFWIFFGPVILYYFDRYDWFSVFKFTQNLTLNYDWLSFLGTYAGTLISAVFLIVITRMDREANTENVRESQRPNLNVRLELPNNSRFANSGLDGYIYFSDNQKETSDKYIIRILNSGQTMAAIDVDKSYIISKLYKNENDAEPTIEKVYLNKYEDRIHVASEKEMNLVITDLGMYQYSGVEVPSISEIYIEYKDLFNNRYKDCVKIENGKSVLIADNQLINE